jgi:hypothetical protein
VRRRRRTIQTWFLPLAKYCSAPAIVWLLAATPATAAQPAATTETIVMVRHGEKPALGLGQLDCQGLNRALALPAVIDRDFGKPDAVIAPNPADVKIDNGKPYSYVRPLATIEPTAVAFGLPVDTSIGFSDIDALRRKLEGNAFRNALVLVGWEHIEIVQVTRLLVANHGGKAGMVPDWDTADFDSIYVIRITRTGKASTVAFEHRHEGLDGASTTCPTPPPAR